MNPSRAVIDIGTALALFVLSSLAAAMLVSQLPQAYRMPAVVVSQGVLLIAIAGGLLAWRGQRWRAIGLVPPGPRDGPRALVAFGLCLIVNLAFIYTLYGAWPRIVEMHSERLGFITQQLTGGLPFPVLVAVLGFVGFYEEVFARGLLLDRCRVLFSGTWAPVLASSLLFGLGHLYQGWIGVGQTTLIGIVFALLVIRWGTLWPAILAHALLDISSVVFTRAAG